MHRLTALRFYSNYFCSSVIIIQHCLLFSSPPKCTFVLFILFLLYMNYPIIVLVPSMIAFDSDAVTSISLSATITASTSTRALIDYCLNESFNASCDPGHVILVTSARFGRMRPGRCISGDFNVGCVKDVKRLLDSACALRISCDVSIRSFVDLHPCQRDFVSYLEASYECIRGKRNDYIAYLNCVK